MDGLKQNFNVSLLPAAVKFLETLEDKAKEKVLYNIRKAQYVNDKELFKKINEHIWEFRTLYAGNAYRLFAFWDHYQGTQKVVIATHGIVKKAQKTPPGEIGKAETIRLKYFDNKLINKQI
jgi:phage-related protein